MLFLVLKTLWYVDEQDAVETGEINLFVGRDFVVTVRHGQGIDLADLPQGPRAAGPGPRARADGGDVRDLRPRRRRVRAGRRRAGGPTSTRSRSPSSPPPAPTTRCASTPSSARSRRYAARSCRCASRCASFALAEVSRDRREDRHLLPGRLRPPPAGLGGHRQPRRAALHRFRRAPGAHLGAAERGHAQDLRRRRAGRRTDPHRGGLRHELRPHARAALDLRLPLRDRPDGRRLGVPAVVLQEVGWL